MAAASGRSKLASSRTCPGSGTSRMDRDRSRSRSSRQRVAQIIKQALNDVHAEVSTSSREAHLLRQKQFNAARWEISKIIQSKCSTCGGDRGSGLCRVRKHGISLPGWDPPARDRQLARDDRARGTAVSVGSERRSRPSTPPMDGRRRCSRTSSQLVPIPGWRRRTLNRPTCAPRSGSVTRKRSTGKPPMARADKAVMDSAPASAIERDQRRRSGTGGRGLRRWERRDG